MVQRKLANNKLGIDTDHVKNSDKGSFPSQNQDTKNKGAHLKKKMKKSRSVKNSDFESLRSSPPLKSKDKRQPGKPQTSDHVKTWAATPQKQSPLKPAEASPNYLKSTSSFDARKERSQVSSQTPQNSMIRKSLSPMKSNKTRRSSGSDHKAVGILTKTSSLKLVRTLTKTPSFKPTRISMKKYSPTALCEDFEVQKPTCSSTLKDSKFPTYLELGVGATESEGTSAMKVCPYTYCSLNGHHHDPVPPLKSFLSAKRRLLKAQKIIRLQYLSPRRAKPSRGEMIESDAKQKMLVQKLPTDSMEFDIRPITPLMHEKQADFFIEITSNDMDDTAKGKTQKSLSSTAPCSDIGFEEYLDQRRGNVVLMFNNIKLFKGKDQNVEAGGQIHPLPIAEEDATLRCLSTRGNSLDVCQQISQHGQSDSDGSDMEWEAGNHYELSLYEEPNLQLKGTDTLPVSNSESVSKSDDDINNSYEDILSDEMREGFYDEKSVSSGAWSDDCDSDLDGSYQNIVFGDSYLAGYEQIQEKSYSTCDALEDLTSKAEEDEKHGSVQTQAHPSEEFKIITLGKSQFPEANDDILEMDFELGSDETKCTSGEEDDALFGRQGNETAKEDSTSWLLQNQDSNSVEDFMEQYQDEIHMDYGTTHDSIEFYEFDSIYQSRLSNEVSDKSLTTEIECKEADHDEKIPNVHDRDEMEEEELAVESFFGIQTSELLEDCEQETTRSDARDGIEGREQLQLLAAKSFVGSQSSEILQDSFERIEDTMAAVNNSQIKQESETNETCADETLRHENHGLAEINQDQSETYRFTSSKHSGDQAHLEAAVLQSTPNSNQEAATGEDESKTEPDAAETSFTAESSTSIQKEEYISNIRSNYNEDTTEAAKILNWTTGSRKIVEESDEVRNFNPREPNYLPVEADPEAEKVDLRHQMIDDRKNAEEWMVDYALRQAVKKLAPARRRKVALLVEAFEKVLPTPKYETHRRHTSAAFVQARTIQACI